MGVLPDENPIAFYLDEEKLQALPGETLLQAAQRQGRKIPHLCCKEGLSNEANCRACLIEIAGISKLVPACKYTPSENDRVVSQSGRAERVQQLVVELLATEAGGTEYPEFNELGLWRAALLPKGSRFRAEQGLAKDKSHPAIAFDPNA